MAAAAATTLHCCLVMIVKDEEAVVGRAIASCWSAVDAWVVVDTGSTDNTEQVVAEATRGKPGVFLHRPWVAFGHNRTEALTLAREHFGAVVGWLLMMDADDSLVLAASHTRLPILPADHPAAPPAYNLVMKGEGGIFYRPTLTKASLPWKYVGKLHEVPVLEGGGAAAGVPILPEATCYIVARTEGVRSRQPDKYRQDALLLEAELVSAEPPEGGRNRVLFYCAQSWRDAGNTTRAVQLYKEVAANPTQWVEERYVACWNVVTLATDWPTIMRYAWWAFELNPSRRDATYDCLRRARAAGKVCKELAALALVTDLEGAERCDAAAFLLPDPEAYTWKFADEACIAAANSKAALRFGQEQAMRCLRAPGCDHARVIRNLAVVQAAMAPAAASSLLLGRDTVPTDPTGTTC